MITNSVFLVQSIEPDLTDQIPVEDNSVYITMKTIDLMKNNAYETVIVAKTPRLCML